MPEVRVSNARIGHREDLLTAARCTRRRKLLEISVRAYSLFYPAIEAIASRDYDELLVHDLNFGMIREVAEHVGGPTAYWALMEIA